MLPVEPHELTALPHWRAVEFISDLHLGPDTPRSFDAWAAYLRDSDADAIVLLGDVFEAWVGDDAAQEARTFEAQAAAVLADAARRRTVAFMAGNRDFLVGDDLAAATGMQRLPDPTVLAAFGRRVLLTHGDALCLSDTSYQAFRAQVRDPAWQRAFLSRPLAERRAVARGMRDASEAGKRSRAPAEWVDVDPEAAVAWLRDARAPDMVHGHTHRPATQAIADGFTRHVLSDWDLDAAPPRAEVLRLTRDGFERHTP
jgi:UDP-2,3-diacylglucosamine hydrolase